MGWMEVVREQPPENARHLTPEYKRLIVGQLAPEPLTFAAQRLARAIQGKQDAVRSAFPILYKIREGSSSYVDEDLWLPPDEVVELLDEFLRLRGVYEGQVNVQGMDSRLVPQLWRDIDTPEVFDAWLDQLEHLLWQAVESRHWVRLMM